MSPILRRKKKKATPFEQAAGYLKLGAKGLAVQRLARKTVQRYKVTKKVAGLAGLAGVGAVVAKKVSGRSGTSTEPPAPAAAPSGPPAGMSATAAATAATGTPPAADTEPVAGPDVSEALEGTGIEGDGPDTPKEAAAPGVGDESSTNGEASADPPADASRTEEGLDVEGPNQSTPPPPGSATTK